MRIKSFEPDVFNCDCPAQKALDLVADKWILLAILALMAGPKRHTDLKRKLKGISQKMLTQTLRRLEADGIVERTISPLLPVQVEYALTPLGATLLEPIQALSAWAIEHSLKLEEARGRYG